MRRNVVNAVLSLLGAAGGGVVGFYAVDWAGGQGFQAVVLAGTLLGLGCGLASRRPSIVRGILCGVAGLVVGVLAEWYTRPFADDQSLGFFLRHLTDLPPFTLILIGVGALAAFWLGKGYMLGERPAGGAGLGPGTPPA